MITHAVGLSLGPTSSVESGVAVRELASGKLIYVDKLFSMNDVSLFFENYPSIKNKLVFKSNSNDQMKIAITFDAAWSAEDTDEIIEILENEYPNAECSLDFTNPFEPTILHPIFAGELFWKLE